MSNRKDKGKGGYSKHLKKGGGKKAILYDALDDGQLFGKIIKELDNAPSIDFNSTESKIKLENELRGHLDFLTNFINKLDDKDKLMQYINLIVSDFQIDEYFN